MNLRRFTQEEDDLILNKTYPDKEIAKTLKRSLSSVQQRRVLLKKNLKIQELDTKKESAYSFEVLDAQVIIFTQARVKIGNYIVSGTFSISTNETTT